jgi:hypothetical protein
MTALMKDADRWLNRVPDQFVTERFVLEQRPYSITWPTRTFRFQKS